jgi:hypothetical protein
MAGSIRLASRDFNCERSHVEPEHLASIESSILKDALGFEEEVLLTPEDGIVSRPRPDFFYRLGRDQGMIAEVERGGTVTNNHDLKDIWKTYLAQDAQHLFLIVRTQIGKSLDCRASDHSPGWQTEWAPSSGTRAARLTSSRVTSSDMAGLSNV